MTVLVAVTLGGAVLVLGDGPDPREEQAAALRLLGRLSAPPPGSAPQAGISARNRVEVAPFPARRADALHDDADFHRLVHRCGVCHSTPDPALHTVAGWDSVVTRMSAHMDDAGLLRLSDADRAAILRALKAELP